MRFLGTYGYVDLISFMLVSVMSRLVWNVVKLCLGIDSEGNNKSEEHLRFLKLVNYEKSGLQRS